MSWGSFAARHYAASCFQKAVTLFDFVIVMDTSLDTSWIWVRCVVAKGNDSRTHATPETIPLPGSTFLRVFAKICQNPIYMPWFGKKFKIKSCFWMPNKLNQHKHSIYLTPDQFDPSKDKEWAFGPFFVYFVIFHYCTRFKSAKRARPLLSLL